MLLRERRRTRTGDEATEPPRLTPSQRGALVSLRHLGWELSFVRHPLFQAPAVVIHDAERKRFAVLEADGTINEHHGLKLREPA
jgi:hypothetical protein